MLGKISHATPSLTQARRLAVPKTQSAWTPHATDQVANTQKIKPKNFRINSTQNLQPKFAFTQCMDQACGKSTALEHIIDEPHTYFSNVQDQDLQRVSALTKIMGLLLSLKPETLKRTHSEYFENADPHIDYTDSIMDFFQVHDIGHEAMDVLDDLGILDPETKDELEKLSHSIARASFDHASSKPHKRVSTIDRLLNKLNKLKDIVCHTFQSSDCTRLNGDTHESFHSFYDQSTVNEGKLNQCINALSRGRRMNDYSAALTQSKQSNLLRRGFSLRVSPSNIPLPNEEELSHTSADRLFYYTPKNFSSLLIQTFGATHIASSELSSSKKFTLSTLLHTMALEHSREDKNEAPICLLASEREAVLELAASQLRLLTGDTSDEPSEPILIGFPCVSPTSLKTSIC